MAYELLSRNRYGVELFRQYIPDGNSLNHAVDPMWFRGYEELGLDVTSLTSAYDYWHDYQVLDYLDKYGTDHFRLSGIWNKDWVGFAKGKKEHPERFKDPRSWIERKVQDYAIWSNRNGGFAKSLTVRILDKVLRYLRYSS